MHVPFVECHMAHVEALKFIVFSVVNMYFGIIGLLLIHCFSIKEIAVMHWSEPKSYNKPFMLLPFQDFDFRGL